MTDTKNILNFLHTIEHLKLEKRTGWRRCGIPVAKSESIADHMYRMAMMVLVLQDDPDSTEKIDNFKLLKMVLVHDMAEAIVGDITPHCGVPEAEKYRRENEAMLTFRTLLGNNPFGGEACELWLEYSANITLTAQLAKQVDKAELYVQVVEYENRFKINFQDWLDGLRPKISHPALLAIIDAAELERPADFLAAKLKK